MEDVETDNGVKTMGSKRDVGICDVVTAVGFSCNSLDLVYSNK